MRTRVFLPEYASLIPGYASLPTLPNTHPWTTVLVREPGGGVSSRAYFLRRDVRTTRTTTISRAVEKREDAVSFLTHADSYHKLPEARGVEAGYVRVDLSHGRLQVFQVLVQHPVRARLLRHLTQDNTTKTHIRSIGRLPCVKTAANPLARVSWEVCLRACTLLLCLCRWEMRLSINTGTHTRSVASCVFNFRTAEICA